MALSYQTITAHDLGGGIDARSAENLIPDSFAEDILNGDTLESRVKKRVGHQGHAGYVPVRVSSIEFETGKIIFELDSSIDLLNVRSTPLVVYGRSSAVTGNSGSLTEVDGQYYYPEFIVDPRLPMTIGGSPLTVLAADHQQTTSNLFVGTVESTSDVNLSHQTFIPDGLAVDETTYDVDMEYDQTEDAGKNALIYFASKDASIGSVHVIDTRVPISLTSDSAAGNIRTLTVNATTHQLNNFQIIPEFYQIFGGKKNRIIPDSMTISNAGLVTISFDSTTHPTGDILSDDIVVILSAAPSANLLAGQIDAGSTENVSITITDETQKFPFVASYLIDPATNEAELVISNRVIYDDDITDFDTVRDLSVEFTNDTGAARNFEVYYEFGSIVTNRLEVTDANQTYNGIDNLPQVTIWGLCHEVLYGGSTAAREGWVSHIDSYRRSAESRLVCGLGGNLFTSRTYSEVSSDYGLPLLYPRLRNRVASNTNISPLFHDTGEAPGRARGYVTADTGGSNWLEITDINWVSGNTVKYTIAAPSIATFDSSDVATADTDLIAGGYISTSDQITISDTGYARHNGTFTIDSANIVGSTIEVTVTNSSVDNADYDETDVCGLAGVFTDRIPLNSNSEFINGDTLQSGAFTAADLHIVIATPEDAAIIVDGIWETRELAAGVRVNGIRTSNIIPLRTVIGTADSTNMVQGDNLTYTDLTRQFRVRSVHPRDAVTVSSISGDGTAATVEITGDDTTPLRVGDTVLLLRCGVYSGTHTITQITDLDTFQVSSTLTASVSPASGVIAGHYIEIDEQFQWEDDQSSNNTLFATRRWIPVEAPSTSGDLPQSNYIQHFDTNNYVSQPFLRSTMASDNMYFTNGDDEVMKFDGTNVYRAGLFRWQPGLFTSVDETASGKIVIDQITLSESAAPSGNKFFVSNGESGALSIGDQIIHSTDSSKYTIIKIVSPDTGNDTIFVDSAITGGIGNISTVTTYSYYFRLNAIDANSNQIASAVTGVEDFVVELGADAAVNIRLMGMPAWDIYDYDRLEVEIYRTLANQSAPYYKIATLPMSFNNGEGYIDYTDTAPDDVLTTLDPVNSVLLGEEVGTGWTQPLRAKYITSADNRLILANLRDYPEVDIQIEDTTSNTLSNFVGSRFLFRRDNTDTNTTTDNTNRVAYEIVDSPSFNPSGYISIDSTTLEIFSTVPTAVTAAGQWIYIGISSPTAGKELDLAGWYQVKEYIDPNTFRITYPHTVAPVPMTPARNIYTATDPRDIPVFVGIDYNRATKFGNSSLSPKTQVMNRLGEAINASMRAADITVSGQESFTPWLIANSGGEFRAGQLIVRQPRVEPTTFEVVLPSAYTNFRIAVNDIFRSAGSSASARERIFPSRIVQSYPNFPEIFDSPNAVSETDSDSVSDVNASDGQELTGIIPFFGESVTSAAQKEAIVVPFKENSVYVYSTSARSVQKLETQGIGCTAPYSIAPSKEGINFATDSGIYQIDRSFRLRYLGRRMERKWQEDVNRNRLDIVQGHHFALGRQYKLSVPIGDDSVANSEVYVYDHTREAEGREGAWTRYDSHSATGWANLDQDAFFATTGGRVFALRRAGDETDFRDDDQPISFDFRYRHEDFGDAGRRKVCNHIVTHLRANENTVGTRLSVTRDLEIDYEETEFLYTPRDEGDSGIDDIINKAVITVSSSVGRRRFVYFQVRYTNSTIDEPVEITGIDYRIAGLTSDGITQAAQRTRGSS